MSPAGPGCTARQWRVPAGRVEARATTTAAGDFRIDGEPAALARRRRHLHPGPWTWLRQVHGAEVVEVARPGHGAGAVADGAATVTPGCPLAVATADCAPLVLVAEAGVAVVHAGWRGAEAGVIDRAVEALDRLGAGSPVASWLGPCIAPSNYEFGPEPLRRLAARFGDDVVARTAWDTPALDLRAVVRSACRRNGWPPPLDPPCTTDPRWYSHRARGDTGRQVTVAWLEDEGGRS